MPMFESWAKGAHHIAQDLNIGISVCFSIKTTDYYRLNPIQLVKVCLQKQKRCKIVKLYPTFVFMYTFFQAGIYLAGCQKNTQYFVQVEYRGYLKKNPTAIQLKELFVYFLSYKLTQRAQETSRYVIIEHNTVTSYKPLKHNALIYSLCALL